MLLANVCFLTCNTAICLDQNQASRNLIVTTSYKKRWLEIVLDRYATSQAFIFLPMNRRTGRSAMTAALSRHFVLVLGLNYSNSIYEIARDDIQRTAIRKICVLQSLSIVSGRRTRSRDFGAWRCQKRTGMGEGFRCFRHWEKCVALQFDGAISATGFCRCLILRPSAPASVTPTKVSSNARSSLSTALAPL